MLTALYSTALTDLLFEKSSDFVGIFDLSEERFVRVNPAGIRILGFSSEQALLSDPVRSRSLRVPPLADEYRTRLIKRITQAGQYEETVQIGRQDGQPFWGKLIISAFADHDRPFALVRLIDQGPGAEQAAHVLADAQRVELQRVFEQAPVGVAVFRGPRYVIEWANVAVCAMWGRTPEQARHTPLFTLLPEASGQGFEQLLDGVMATGVSHVAHELPSTINRQGHPHTVYWNFVYQPLRAVDGQITGVTVVATDATEQVLARQQIQTLNEELAGANEKLRIVNAELEQKVAERTHALMNTLDQLEQSKNELAKALAAEQRLGELKSRFVSMASHEFRTPLTALLTSATLVEKYAGADQQAKRRKHLDHIRTSVKHLNNILEEFLSVGKIEAGMVKSQPAEVDLAHLMSGTVTDMQGLLKPGQTVQTHLSCPSPVWLDPSLLRKILINLLTNALKYSGPGSTATVRATCTNEALTLTVQDEGVGIPKADQAHLFERFFRAKNVEGIAGTGLGLHIVGRYVELMGGSVALQSVLDQGTTVTITLPYENDPAD